MGRKNDEDMVPITDEMLSDFMGKMYNGWFHRWRDRMSVLSDADFDTLMTEATTMIDQYAQYPLVRNLVVSFVYELDARMHGGYTKASVNRLLRLIGGETAT